MDKDLAFLTRCSNEELEFLFQILIDRGSKTEFITCSEEYNKYGADYQQYVDLLVKEVLDFGSNTFWFREDYHTVAQDACKKSGVSCNSSDSSEAIEKKLCAHLMGETWKSLSADTQMAFIEGLGYSSETNRALLKQAGYAIFYELFKRGGLASYQMSAMLINSLALEVSKKEIPFAVNALVMPVASRAAAGSAVTTALSGLSGILAGPLGLVLTAAWSIGGPAYRVTVPAVTYIGCLRNMKKYR